MNGDTRPPQPARRKRGRPSPLSNTVAVLLLIALAVFAYTRFSRDRADGQAAHAAAPAAPLAAPVERPIDLGKACDGRTQCAQMTSCTEAKYFLQNCPGVQMDSNRNGIPCEKSWCNSPLAR